jgi:hypothetical protein
MRKLAVERLQRIQMMRFHAIAFRAVFLPVESI